MKCVSVKCVLILKSCIHRTIVVKTNESQDAILFVIGLIQDLTITVLVFSYRYFLSAILGEVSVDNVESIRAFIDVRFAYSVLAYLNRRAIFAVFGNRRFAIVFLMLVAFLHPFFFNSVTASKNEDRNSNGAACDQKENLSL